MICSGPGCKAWDSEKVWNLVRDSIDKDIEIISHARWTASTIVVVEYL